MSDTLSQFFNGNIRGQRMGWPTWVVLLGIGAIVFLLVVVAAALDGINAAVRGMEHWFRAQEHRFSAVCKDVSEIERTIVGISLSIDTLESRSRHKYDPDL